MVVVASQKLANTLEYVGPTSSLPVEVMRLGVRKSSDTLLSGGSGSVVGHLERRENKKVSE